ncbi:hypothetical protein JDV02_008597 [Purpureocillium takamizusanense]|uniref:Uncharacterized protein n=1 Tax=Purpureocillium takamizusanense TaxID=2060973 RepID=A0A9Q8QKI5_9HYPO|nr:uncharacterized protein JDV02_008597 [Purpureocillium takamizusanense]UNI22734.1 hypothetical protein JDV02_008597 [Purpureocillium takamizusanense]
MESRRQEQKTSGKTTMPEPPAAPANTTPRAMKKERTEDKLHRSSTRKSNGETKDSKAKDEANTPLHKRVKKLEVKAKKLRSENKKLEKRELELEALLQTARDELKAEVAKSNRMQHTNNALQKARDGLFKEAEDAKAKLEEQATHVEELKWESDKREFESRKFRTALSAAFHLLTALEDQTTLRSLVERIDGYLRIKLARLGGNAYIAAAAAEEDEEEEDASDGDDDDDEEEDSSELSSVPTELFASRDETPSEASTVLIELRDSSDEDLGDADAEDDDCSLYEPDGTAAAAELQAINEQQRGQQAVLDLKHESDSDDDDDKPLMKQRLSQRIQSINGQHRAQTVLDLKHESDSDDDKPLKKLLRPYSRTNGRVSTAGDDSDDMGKFAPSSPLFQDLDSQIKRELLQQFATPFSDSDSEDKPMMKLRSSVLAANPPSPKSLWSSGSDRKPNNNAPPATSKRMLLDEDLWDEDGVTFEPPAKRARKNF